MKSLVMGQRRARRIAAATCCASIILGFVACSGSSERRAPRNTGAGGDYDAMSGGAPQSGGSKAQGGNSAAAGESSAGAPGVSGTGGSAAGEASGGADTGAGGADVSIAGQASSGEGGTGVGGAGAGGESSGGAGGEGGSAPHLDPVCGVNMVQVGAYSLWCGKVNMHLTAEGTWTHDADCDTGCDFGGKTALSYCQKYYPSTTTIVSVNQLQSVVKDWKNAGCADSEPDGPGIGGEAACCAPIP